MARVPNSDKAVVAESKVIGYLLSDSHRDGRHKAQFFASFGFVTDHWDLLAEALKIHVRSHDVTNGVQNEFGAKFIVDGILETSDGRNPKVRSVWFVEIGETSPRFVTAYPQRG